MRLALPFNDYPGNERRVASFRDLLAELETTPGITSAAASSALPFSDWYPTRSFLVEGHDPPEQEAGPWGEWAIVTPGHFETLGIPLLRGRDFTTREMEEAAPVAVVDTRLA
jgi:hypothetical protein